MSLFKNRFWGSSLTLSFVVMGAVQGNSVFAEGPDLKKLLSLWEGTVVYSDICMLDCAICMYYSFFKKPAFTKSILTFVEDLTKLKTKLNSFEAIIRSLKDNMNDTSTDSKQNKKLIDKLENMDGEYFMSEYKLKGKYPEISVSSHKGPFKPEYWSDIDKYIKRLVSYVKEAKQDVEELKELKKLKKTDNKQSAQLVEAFDRYVKLCKNWRDGVRFFGFSGQSTLGKFLHSHDRNMLFLESYLEEAAPRFYPKRGIFIEIEESFSVLMEEYKNLKDEGSESFKKHVSDFYKKLESWENELKFMDGPTFEEFFKERIKKMKCDVEKCADRVEKSAEQVEAIKLLEEIEKDHKALVGSYANFGNGFSDVDDNLNEDLKSFKKHEGEFLELVKKTDKKLEKVYDISFKPLFNHKAGYMNKLGRVYFEIEKWKQEVIEGKISPDDSFCSKLDMEDETKFLEKNNRMVEALGEYITPFLNESESKDEIVKKMNSLKENETLWQKVENIGISVEVEDKNKEVKKVKAFNTKKDFENFVGKLAEYFEKVLEESEKTLELFKSGIWSEEDCSKALNCRLLNTFVRQKGINENLFNWGVALLKLAVKQQLNANEPKVNLTDKEEYTVYLIDNKLFYVGFFDDIGKIISIINKVNKDVKIPLYEKQLESKESNYVIDISNIYMQPMQGFF